MSCSHVKSCVNLLTWLLIGLFTLVQPIRSKLTFDTTLDNNSKTPSLGVGLVEAAQRGEVEAEVEVGQVVARVQLSADLQVMQCRLGGRGGNSIV